MGHQPFSIQAPGGPNRGERRQGHGPAIQPLRVHEGHGDGCEPVAKERSSAPEHDGTQHQSILVDQLRGHQRLGQRDAAPDEHVPSGLLFQPGDLVHRAAFDDPGFVPSPQLARSRVFEKTTFGVAFNLSANGFSSPSVTLGQKPANMR